MTYTDVIKKFRAWWSDEKGDEVAVTEAWITEDSIKDPHVTRRAWVIEELIQDAYIAGRESLLAELKAHLAEIDEQWLSVDSSIRLSKANKRGQRA